MTKIKIPKRKPHPPERANPGSSLARSWGCTCSAVLNAYGHGFTTKSFEDPQFMFEPNCPLHRGV